MDETIRLRVGSRAEFLADITRFIEQENLSEGRDILVALAPKPVQQLSDSIFDRMVDWFLGTLVVSSPALIIAPFVGGAIVVDVKKSMLRLGITALATVPLGLLAAAPAMAEFFLTSKAISFAEYESGAACNVLSMSSAAATPMSASYLSELTRDKPCIRPNVDCSRRLEGICRVDEEQVRENLIRLEERGAIKNTGADAFVPVF